MENKGRVRSRLTCKVMSEKKKGERNPKFKGYYVTPKGVFSTAAVAAEANGVNIKTIRSRCVTPLFSATGWMMSDNKDHAVWQVPVYVPVSKEKKPMLPADRYYQNVNYSQV